MNMLTRLARFVPQLRRLQQARDTLLDQRDGLARRLAGAETQCRALEQLLQESERQRSAFAGSPFSHYNATFDPIEVIRRHAATDLIPSSRHLTNFLGVRIDPKFFPPVLANREGQIEGVLIPANWHADIAEWGMALRAVDMARDRLTMIELGCGWGCWMNNTGVAARNAGLDMHLIGVEGDEGHVEFAREALADNGFASNQITLHRGVAAASSGVALFPRQSNSSLVWGAEPVFGASDEQREMASRDGTHDELPMVSLSDLVEPHERIDLLHIDIQGGEAKFIEGCLPIMHRKAVSVLIGTHSRQIEGRLLAVMSQAGWLLEMERPAIFKLHLGQPQLLVDGVQGWRNPNFAV
nr:FkbM family methyltransferase [uncultured Lichenicoccus sp.]